MRNPWLSIPLADYESHMDLPHVAQSGLLADALAASVAAHTPRSVAVLGCAGGNGFDHIPPATRVVGIDLNPDYVNQARARFGRRFATLELHVGDIERDRFDAEPVDLAFAGLLFEYVDPPATLERIHTLLVPGGKLVSVVQLPASGIPEVTPSPFTSLDTLTPIMKLVSPDALADWAAARGYLPRARRTVETPAGKGLCIQEFRRSGEPLPASLARESEPRA